MPIPQLPLDLTPLSGDDPPGDHVDWQTFLLTRCELRDHCQGVLFYGDVTGNYIVFPCGTIVENFGYHGATMMNHIRDVGRDFVLDTIKKSHARTRQLFYGDPSPTP